METSPQLTSRPNRPRSPWFTLISRPADFFSSRRDRIGWVWVTLACSLMSGIALWMESPYLIKSAFNQPQLAQLPANVGNLIETITKVTTIIGGFTGPWVSAIATGFLIWLLVLMFGGRLRYMNAVGIAANVHFITAISAVLTAIIAVSTGKLPYGLLSLNMLTHTFGHIGGLLTTISVFSIWALVLLIIAFSKMTKLSRGKIIGIVAIEVALVLLSGLAGSVPAA